MYENTRHAANGHENNKKAANCYFYTVGSRYLLNLRELKPLRKNRERMRELKRMFEIAGKYRRYE